MRIRRKRGQTECPTVGALNTQSVKWGNRQGDNGFDGNKKVKGIKRNIVVDRNGFILGRLTMQESMIPNLPIHSASRHLSFGRHLRKFLWTEGIAERLRIR